MASQGAITLKTANAVEAIQKASTKLAKKFDLEIQPFPDVRKYDPALGRAMQLEYLADVLTQVASATTSKAKAEKVEKDEPEKEPAKHEAVIPTESGETAEAPKDADKSKGKK
jgi:23S rRNA A1618 N6-methylase RlmF